ncbi:hypothetical protein BJV82DRAFT_110351 [Fennellomyces sp. T-0311]|nr:hypothetical protein BJV82DRAFT_110351 [Fennellomyces sp. T-0311]
MASSQTDEFFDDWGDMSPGFTDRVLQNVTLVEKRTSMTRKPYPNEKPSNTFQVFRDPLDHGVASPQSQHLTPLREIDLNQHVTLTKAAKAKQAKATKPVESDDDMWMEFDVDFESMIHDLEKDGALEQPTLNTDTVVKEEPGKDEFVKEDSVDKHKVESTLTKFGGFVNAFTEKSMKSTSKAREKALFLFNQPKDDDPENGTSIPTDDEPLFNFPKKHRTSEPSEAPKISKGFTTGRGNPVARSSEASLRKAQSLLFAPEETNKDPQCGEKRAAPDDLDVQFKYEDVLSEFGGFKTAKTETTITVSNEAKRRAVSLFNSSESTRELTQASQTTQKSPNSSFSSQQSLLRTLSLETETIQPPPSPDQQVPKPAVRKPAKTRPFRSPVIKEKYELTKAAVSGQPVPGTVRGKGPCVFSMKANVPRYPLSQLGKPLQYSYDQLKRMNISDEILHLGIANAANVQFSGWGHKDAHQALLKAGALEKFISSAWVENHYRWIVWKIACIIRSYPTQFKDWWCQDKIMDQLLYRYEREINLGHRSVLKRIHEHDDTPAKHMVLVVAAIIKLDSVPQDDKGTRKKHVDACFAKKKCDWIRSQCTNIPSFVVGWLVWNTRRS